MTIPLLPDSAAAAKSFHKAAREPALHLCHGTTRRPERTMKWLAGLWIIRYESQ
jgi:hypothetical protein